MSSPISKSPESSQDKDSLWWKAFRETILDAHSIQILQKPTLNKLPRRFFDILDRKCQDISRHQAQARAFLDAVAAGDGFSDSEDFPTDLLPALKSNDVMSRCAEPTFDRHIIPPRRKQKQTSNRHKLPQPCPNLACGFSSRAFNAQELEHLPSWMASTGTAVDRPDADETVFCSYFLFNRADSPSKNDVQSALNDCAVDGSAALRAMSLLYESAWPGQRNSALTTPHVFSCTIHDELAIINHHWMDEENAFSVSPLCRFELTDVQHTMQFLAWVEAIEQWAESCLLPNLRTALNTIICQDMDVIDALPKAAVTIMMSPEPEEHLMDPRTAPLPPVPVQRSNSRARTNPPTCGTPLGITGRMRPTAQKTANSENGAEEMPWNDIHPAMRRNRPNPLNMESSAAKVSSPLASPALQSPRMQPTVPPISTQSISKPEPPAQRNAMNPPSRKSSKRSARPPTLETIISESPDSPRSMELPEPEPVASQGAPQKVIKKARSVLDLVEPKMTQCESPTTGFFDSTVIQTFASGRPSQESCSSGMRSQLTQSSLGFRDDSSITTKCSSIEGIVTQSAQQMSVTSKETGSDISSIITKSDKATEKPRPKAPAKKKRRFSCPIQNYIAERKKRRLRASISLPMDDIPEVTTIKSKVNQGISIIVERSKSKRVKVNARSASADSYPTGCDSESTLAASIQTSDAGSLEKQRQFEMEPPPTATHPDLTNAWIDHVLSDRMVCSEDCSDHSDGGWHSDDEDVVVVPQRKRNKHQSQALAYRYQDRNMKSATLSVAPLRYVGPMI